MLSASLSLVDSTNDVSTILDRSLGVEGSMLTGNSLYEDLGVLVDENMWSSLSSVETSLHNMEEWFVHNGLDSLVQHIFFV
jgi:hypothetical protein